MGTNLRRTLGMAGVVVGLVAATISITHGQSGIDWANGDVVTSVNGVYTVYSHDGVLKETLHDPVAVTGETAGCAFDVSGNLYIANFAETKVRRYAALHPHAVTTIDTNVTSPAGHSESIIFASNGDFYVGHPDGNHWIHRYNAAGVLQATYAPAVENRGTDHMDLAADQHTMVYTSEGRSIKRFDVGTNTQLSDFVTLPNDGGTAYGVRWLPTGGLLVADSTEIKRLDASGTVVQTYDAEGENGWFALSLDPNGTSFWSGGVFTRNFYRFNIATGAKELGPITAQAPAPEETNQPIALGGLCIKGEPTVSAPEQHTIHYDPGTNVSHTFMFGTGPGASTLQVTFDQVNAGFDLTFSDRLTNQAAVAPRLAIFFAGYICTQHADANCHEYMVEEPIPVKDVDFTGFIHLENRWPGVYNNTRLLQDRSDVDGNDFTVDDTHAGYTGQGVDGLTDGFSGFLKADAPPTAALVVFSSPSQDDLTVYKMTRTAVPVKFMVRSALPPFGVITPLVPRLSVEFCPPPELPESCHDGVPIAPISSVGKSNTENIARFDPGAMQWIYNLDISGLTNVGKYHLVVIDAEGPTTPPKFPASGVFFHLQ